MTPGPSARQKCPSSEVGGGRRCAAGSFWGANHSYSIAGYGSFQSHFCGQSGRTVRLILTCVHLFMGVHADLSQRRTPSLRPAPDLAEIGVAGQQQLKQPRSCSLALADSVRRRRCISPRPVRQACYCRQRRGRPVEPPASGAARHPVGRRNEGARLERRRRSIPLCRSRPSRLTSVNAREIIRQFDIVIDGSDNFPTRYLVNDACVFERKPLVYGSILRFEGQLSLFGAAGARAIAACSANRRRPTGAELRRRRCGRVSPASSARCRHSRRSSGSLASANRRQVDCCFSMRCSSAFARFRCGVTLRALCAAIIPRSPS